MEIEIVYELAQKILMYETMLVEASDICGELDRFVIHQSERIKLTDIAHSRSFKGQACTSSCVLKLRMRISLISRVGGVYLYPLKCIGFR